MPYLEQAIRASLDDGRKPLKGGELNYLISKMLNEFMANRGVSYTVMNEALGALEAAKLEFYRRVAGPYEDQKARANGEVYTILP